MRCSCAALLALALGGCASTREEAEARRVLVDVGMTGRQVVDRIGRPTKIFAVEPTPGQSEQTVEVWAYSMKPPPDLGDAAEFALSAGALIALSVAAGHDPPASILNGPRGKGRCTFWVGFGRDGRVRGVTNLEVAR